MTPAPEWFLWAFPAMCFVAGWLTGTRWVMKRHLADLRRHIAWIEEYTAAVNDLLTDLTEVQNEPAPTPSRSETV